MAVVPDAPLGVSVVPGDTTAIVTWQSPLSDGGSSVIAYLVTVSSTGFTATYTDTFYLVTETPSVSTAWLLTGLTNGVTYTVTVVAVNAVGSSAASTGVVFVTATSDTGAVQLDPNAPPDFGPSDVDPALMPSANVFPPLPATSFKSMPGAAQALSPVAAAIAAGQNPDVLVARTVAGQLQMAALQDRTTGEVLVLLPSLGGIWVNDLDLGYPTVREVSSNWPGAHGSIDGTLFYSERAVTLSLTCGPAPDVNGVMQSASRWADVIRGWTSLGRRIKLVYQLRDQYPREVFLRTSSLGAPIVGSGTGRVYQSMTIGFKSPEGFLYTLPLPGYPTDPNRPDYYYLGVGGSAGGTAGLSLNGATGISLGPGVSLAGGKGATGNTVAVPPATVGSVPVFPVITLVGGATQPKFSMLGSINGAPYVRAALEFTVSVGGNLTVAATDVMVVDVQNRTALVYLNGDRTQPGINVFKYLAAPVSWQDFFVAPQDQGNQFNFYPVASNAGTQAFISYRQGWV